MVEKPKGTKWYTVKIKSPAHLKKRKFFCHLIFLIEEYLLYKMLWFSVIHQQESAMSPPS